MMWCRCMYSGVMNFDASIWPWKRLLPWSANCCASLHKRLSSSLPAMSKHSARPVALVTGGAKRIGKQIAQTLAAHGWNIALHYRSSGEEAEAALQSLDTLGGDHHLLQADLADASQVRRLFEEACSALGKVDAVINNAAVFEFDDAASF